MLNQLGRVAKIFREGAANVGENAARQRYAATAADDFAMKNAANYDEYLKLKQDNFNNFAGTPNANTYQGLDSAAYNAGAMGGKVAQGVGNTVNSMGGAAGLGMNALFMAPMVAPMFMGGGQPTPEELQMMEMQQRGYR